MCDSVNGYFGVAIKFRLWVFFQGLMNVEFGILWFLYNGNDEFVASLVSDCDMCFSFGSKSWF